MNLGSDTFYFSLSKKVGWVELRNPTKQEIV